MRPAANASWGSQLDMALIPLSEEDILELDYGEDENDTSGILMSEDEEDNDVFIT